MIRFELRCSIFINPLPKKPMKHIVLIFMLAALSGEHCYAQKKQFRLDLKVGNEYTLNLKSTIRTTYPEGLSIYAFDYHYSFLVRGEKKGVFEMDVKQTIATVAYSGKTPKDTKETRFGGTTETSKPTSQNPFTQTLKALQGKIFKMKIDKYGKVLDVNGYGEICSAIRKDFTSEQNAVYVLNKSMDLNMMGIMTDDEFKKRIQEVFLFFPTKTVHVGDTWSQQVNAGIEFFKFDVDMQYKLLTMTDETSTVEGAAVMKQHNSFSDAIPRADDGLEITGTINTIIVVDNDSGWIESAEQINKGQGTAISKGETTQMVVRGQIFVNEKNQEK
jgi:hypothetical protein